MVEYTYQEKIAVMRILLDIVHADGIIDARETFFFNQLRDLFSLDESAYEDVKTKNSLLALVQINSMEPEQKTYFAKLMGKMIVVDEDINVNEVAIYNVVKDFCKIDVKFEDTLTKEQALEFSKS